MQEAHTDLFASAALTLNENGNIGLSYSLQLVPDRLHCSSFAEDNI